MSLSVVVSRAVSLRSSAPGRCAARRAPMVEQSREVSRIVRRSAERRAPEVSLSLLSVSVAWLSRYPLPRSAALRREARARGRGAVMSRGRERFVCRACAWVRVWWRMRRWVNR